jgi:hypothetical protein
MMAPENKEILQWVSAKKEPAESRIMLNKVTRIFFGCDQTKRLKSAKSKLKGKEHLCLAIACERDSKPLELVFENHL